MCQLGGTNWPTKYCDVKKCLFAKLLATKSEVVATVLLLHGWPSCPRFRWLHVWNAETRSLMNHICVLKFQNWVAKNLFKHQASSSWRCLQYSQSYHSWMHLRGFHKPQRRSAKRSTTWLQTSEPVQKYIVFLEVNLNPSLTHFEKPSKWIFWTSKYVLILRHLYLSWVGNPRKRSQNHRDSPFFRLLFRWAATCVTWTWSPQPMWWWPQQKCLQQECWAMA